MRASPRVAGIRVIVTTLCVLGIVLAVSPLLTQSAASLAATAMIFAALAAAWNVAGGFGGIFSVGHSVFFGVGAYSMAIGLVRFDASPWVLFGVGSAVALALGCAVGALALRLKGPFFAIATFALAIAALDITIVLREFTGGNAGLSIPFGAAGMLDTVDRTAAFRWSAGMAAFVVLVAGVLRVSRFGMQLRATRDDRDAAESLGIRTTPILMAASGISAGLAALAGGYYAIFSVYVDPASVFGLAIITAPIIHCVVGGIGTTWGPVIGAVLIVYLSDLLNKVAPVDAAGLGPLSVGVIFIAMALLAPEGLIGLLARLRSRFSVKPGPARRFRRPSADGAGRASGMQTSRSGRGRF